MLDDPRSNSSIDTHGDARDHVDAAALPRTDQNNLVCRYQRQHKSWVSDPHGLKWELFYTEGIADEGYGCDETPAAP